MKKISVKGLAVKEGVSLNRIKYTRKELDKFAKTMEGVKIIKDHEAKVDNIVGKVKFAESINNGEAVYYSGFVTDKEMANKIEMGLVDSVSIGCTVGQLVQESKDSDVLLAKDIVCQELSTVVCPGIPGASISQSIEKNISIIENLNTIKDYSLQEQLEKSHSSDQKSDLKKIKLKEAKNMEGKQEEIAIESNVSKEDFNALKAELNSVKEDRLTELSGRYTRICEKLKISEKKNLSLESLRVLVEQLEEAEEQPAEEPKEETPEEPKEEVKEDPKEEKEEEKSEEPETKSEVSKDVSEESLNGYVVENADTVGMSFYRAE